ncbi:hypothetical protein IAG44_19180 [Streptomyces roseirectus]|uniref:Secreted protein n=1 Tax=Streptomyces roseirectus TaxID=2768066 RepID=A0A7H0IEY0_9ACTN|nr:hypothetical protein [Streptomyces roseirectus]QNP71346.1 hypothetical protein IAG44_19180 [Streptomyces roseirectus]
MSDEKPVRRRRAGAVLGGALLASVVLAGVGYTVVTVRGADREPGDVSWVFPKPAASGGAVDQPAAGSLRALFVPYGTDGLRPGPDVEDFGHDTEFNERQATALRANSLKDMPKKYRDSVEKHRIKSMALRTYLSREDWFGEKSDPYVVQVTLTRLADRSSVRFVTQGYRELADSGVLGKGPVVKGHKDALCLVPKARAGEKEPDEEKLTGIQCTAGVGDLVVFFSATGAGSLDSEGVAAFVAEQLDRIDDPGRAV